MKGLKNDSGSWLNNGADAIDICTGGEEIDSVTLRGLSGIKSSILLKLLVRQLVEM